MTFPREDLPSRQFWKNVSWPIPHPEMTPRPVTTTRSASVANNAVGEEDVDFVVGRVNAEPPRKDDDKRTKDS